MGWAFSASFPCLPFVVGSAGSFVAELAVLEIAQLRYFIAVARGGSFRRAAKSLQVEQSSISRSVHRLEDRLGVSLFERSHAGVRLTDAGQRFLTDAQPALEQLDLAERMAAAAGRGETGTIRMGIITSLAGGLLRELVHSYASQNPSVRIDVRDGGRDDHIVAIRARELDIAFLIGAGDVSDCETSELWRERVHVALPLSHRLARRRRLDWTDLRDERFIVSRGVAGPEVHDYIIRRIADYGTYPEIEVKGAGRETLLNLVSLGQGVTLVSAAWAAVKLPGLVLRPLTDPEDIVPFSAVWSAENDNPALRRFISIAHVLAGRVRRGASDWTADTLSLASDGPALSAGERRPDPSP